MNESEPSFILSDYKISIPTMNESLNAATYLHEILTIKDSGNFINTVLEISHLSIITVFSQSILVFL